MRAEPLPSWNNRTVSGVASPDPPRVLIVDDDVTVADVLSRYLAREGYRVTTATDGPSGLRSALRDLPDLVILDLMLPGINGVEICRRLRATAPIPVIMLTARGEEPARVAGLELGADDYVVKPFSPREVTARAKAVLRRAGQTGGPPAEAATLRAGLLELDLLGRQVRLRDELVPMAAKEFDLLAFLMRHPGRAFRRDDLFKAVWGFEFGDNSTVTVHIRRLRQKIETDPSEPRHLQTVWGVGYRFEP